MTVNKPTPRCPECNNPFVDENGKFQICKDCPFRDPTHVDNNDYSEQANMEQFETMDNDVTITLNVASVFRHMAEQELHIRELKARILELQIELADTFFKQPQKNGDSKESA